MCYSDRDRDRDRDRSRRGGDDEKRKDGDRDRSRRKSKEDGKGDSEKPKEVCTAGKLVISDAVDAVASVISTMPVQRCNGVCVFSHEHWCASRTHLFVFPKADTCLIRLALLCAVWRMRARARVCVHLAIFRKQNQSL